MWHSVNIVRVILTTRWQFCPALWRGTRPSPTPPAQLVGSSQWSWTVIDSVGSPRDLDLSRPVSPSTLCWGELNRTSVRKSLQREKEPCAAHLPDKRFNQPALRHPSPSLSPWDGLKSATTITWWKYPLTTVWWEQSERLVRDWVGNPFNYYTRARPCGVLVAGTTRSHLLSSTLGKINTQEISRMGFKRIKNALANANFAIDI